MSVGILGGGLGGLSAAYYLARSTKCKSIIFESSDSVGGWIKSIHDMDLNVLFEKGPRTIRPKGLQGFNTLCLIEELNLADKVIPIRRDHPTAKNRMIYVNKKIHNLPSSFYSLLKTSSPFSKPLILAIFKDLLSPKQEHSDESIYNFVERRLGKDIADFAISPMICGICAGNAKEISVKFLMASLFEAEQKHGSIVKGLLNNLIFQSEEYPSYIKNSSFYKRVNSEKWSVWYLEGGFQKLTDALNERVQNLGVNISLNSSCTKLEFRNKQIICHVGNDEFLFNHLLSSISAKKLAPLLFDQHPFLSQELDKIPMVSVAVVNVAYKGKHLKDNAFGLLVPPSEKLSILGIVFDSCNFSYTDRTVLTVMMGGRWFNEYFSHDITENEISSKALEHIANILGIKQHADKIHVSILKDCIPQYIVGHHDRIDSILKYINTKKLPISLIGSCFGGISLNDVIMTSKNSVENMF